MTEEQERTNSENVDNPDSTQVKIRGYQNWILGMLRNPHITDHEAASDIARVLAARHAMVDLLARRDEVSQKLYREAHTDALTELPNRRLFNQTYEALVDTRQPFGLLHIDIDNFGIFNNQYGHSGGDEVLVQTALRLLDNVRQTTISRPDTEFFQKRQSPLERDLAARLGGDEFAILLVGVTDPETLFNRGENIRQAIGNVPYLLGDNQQRATVTVSIGGGIFTGHDPQKFLSGVDRYGLYRAKDTRDTTRIVEIPPK